MGGWYWAPLISADPTGKGHVLVAAQPYISSTQAAAPGHGSHPERRPRHGRADGHPARPYRRQKVTGFKAWDTAGNGAIPGWAVATVTVARKEPSLSVTPSPRTASRGQAVEITVHLGPTYTDRTVTVYVRPSGSKQRIRLASGTVKRAGKLTVRWVATRTAVLSAVFAGDSQYQARTVTTTVTVRS